MIDSTTIAQTVTNAQNTTTYSYATTTSQSLISTSTQQELATTTETAPTVQHFGNQLFEPPSAILIPADTLIWTNFQLNTTTYGTNGYVAGTILYFPFPNAMGANITVAIYQNGNLLANNTTPVFNHDYGIASSLVPSSNSSNSIFSLKGLTTDVGMGTQTGSAVSLSGTITVAVMSDKSVWLAGWSQADRSAGTGAKFGQSTGQLPGTFETPESRTIVAPISLPTPTTTLTFELQISGAVMQG